MIAQALEARLKVIEDEVVRLIRLASEAPDQVQQDNYWRLAQDLQREARDLRSQIRKISEPQPRTPSVRQTLLSTSLRRGDLRPSRIRWTGALLCVSSPTSASLPA